MLARYFELREYISTDDEDLAELADVKSVSMKLQSEDLNLLDMHDLLDGLLKVKPSLRHYLAPSADNVTDPEFENGVVKILRGRVKQLYRAEKAALKPFERVASAAAAATEETTNVGNADGILKRWKVQDNVYNMCS
ncbi:hypothetical protein PHMEG_00018590 [Phytophthora megakarya]|uniref:Uncharacterized protein n=1 Tax=Phytophthora megakarya TaxID=4795 RepID=A0A225VTN7_9STRA|nr:hypothetical protein PHMEG_00018590 [Phytophthora megakarya]